MDGPDWGKYGTLDGYLATLGRNLSTHSTANATTKRQGGGSWWLTELGPRGKVWLETFKNIEE